LPKAKVIQELLDSNFELEHLYSTQNDFQAVSTSKKSLINELDLKKISALATPNTCFSFKIQPEKKIDVSGLIVALDSIRPRQLGTILRLCDWFGVTEMCVQRDCGFIQSKSGSGYHGSIARLM
jgi:TrmH family RNA methyltransferase